MGWDKARMLSGVRVQISLECYYGCLVVLLQWRDALLCVLPCLGELSPWRPLNKAITNQKILLELSLKFEGGWNMRENNTWSHLPPRACVCFS